jgi:uncharacterized protein GlcG (DUF336 family)
MSEILRPATIGHVVAQRVVAAAVAAAEDLDVRACVAVVDSSAHLLAFVRMDGAPLLSRQIAEDKAYTVAAFNGVPTHEWWERIADDPALVHGLPQTERMVLFAGGVPITHRRRMVGAVGVSGGSAEQDRTIAEAASCAAPAAGSGR